MSMNMKGGLNQLLKQAQEMQTKMQQAQQQLAEMVIIGESGGGMVKIHMNGRHDVKRVQIDPSLIKTGAAPEDIEVLEDLIAAAINDAVKKVEKASREKLSGLTAGMQLPPGFEDQIGG